MIWSSPGRTVVSPILASRSVQAAAHGLRQAVAQANHSLTLQEGLYRAYTTHLCDLSDLEAIPRALQLQLQDMLVELRSALGFDEVSGTKVTPSTLGNGHAASLLARLEAIASSVEAMTAGAKTAAPP